MGSNLRSDSCIRFNAGSASSAGGAHGSDGVSGRPDRRGPVIAEALRSAASLGSPESSLQALIGLMIQTGPWTAGSICLLTPGGILKTAAYLDARADEADRLQAQYKQGPALDAVRGDPVQLCPDLADDSRWPSWSPMAAALGFGSAESLRLFTNRPLGTVNLYSPRVGRTDPAAGCEAQLMAPHVSVVVAAISTQWHLKRAMLSRNLIGQAQGILMQRNGVTADRALDDLRRRSQQTNTKLIVLARHIAETGSAPEAGDWAG